LLSRMLAEETTEPPKPADYNANRAYFDTGSKGGDLALEIVFLVLLWGGFLLVHGDRVYKRFKLKYDRKMAIINKKRTEQKLIEDAKAAEKEMEEMGKIMDDYYETNVLRPREEEERKKKAEADQKGAQEERERAEEGKAKKDAVAEQVEEEVKQTPNPDVKPAEDVKH
jgi:hypothetical protein